MDGQDKLSCITEAESVCRRVDACKLDCSSVLAQHPDWVEKEILFLEMKLSECRKIYDIYGLKWPENREAERIILSRKRVADQ